MVVLTLSGAKRDHLRGLARRSGERRTIRRALALLDLGAETAGLHLPAPGGRG